MNPIISFILSFFGNLFGTFSLPRLIRLVGRLESPIYWKQSFRKASRLTPEFPEEIALELVNKRALLRFLLNTFKVEKQFPTIRDLTVAIAFELRADRLAVNHHDIKKFAANLYREWCKSLNDNPSLKNYLKDTRGIDPSVLFEKTAPDTEIDSIIQNDQALQMRYFESYSEAGGNDLVRVFLQNEQHWVPYSTERNLSATVNLHTAQGADFGFFLVGYDYLLLKDEKEYYLRDCFEDKKLGTEAARFQNHELGDTSGELFWLM